MNDKDIIKGIDIQAKLDAKKMEKIQEGLEQHSDILDGIKQGQDVINDSLDVVFEDMESLEAKELYGIDHEKHVTELDLTERRVLCSAIYTLLSSLDSPTDIQKTYYMQLSYHLNVHEKNDEFDFNQLKNIDSYKDRLAIIKNILAFLYIGDNTFNYLDSENYIWIYDLLPKNDVVGLEKQIKKEFSLLGTAGFIEDLKNTVPLTDEPFEEIQEINDTPLMVEECIYDKYEQLKSIILYHAEKGELGQKISFDESMINDIFKQFPELVTESIITLAKTSDKYIAFTTYAIYVWQGNKWLGKYVRVPYNSIVYDMLVTAPGKEKNSRKLIIPYELEENQDEVTIDDHLIIEEEFLKMLIEIKNSECVFSETDFEISFSNISNELLCKLASLITYVFKKSNRKIVVSYLEAFKLNVSISWDDILECINDDDEFIKNSQLFIDSFEETFKKSIILKCVREFLYCNSISNFLEDRENGVVAPITEKYINLFSNGNITNHELNALINESQDSINKLSSKDIETIEFIIENNHISFYKDMIADIQKLKNKVTELKTSDKLLKVTNDVVSNVFNGLGKIINNKKNKSIKDCPLQLPEECTPLNKPFSKEVTEEAIGFELVSKFAKGVILGLPVAEDDSMNFEEVNELIVQLHSDMDENSGIVDVKNGKTQDGKSFVYYIQKHPLLDEDGNKIPGVSYSLNMNIRLSDSIYFFKGDFFEEGNTGERDTIILNKLMDEGVVKSKDSCLIGWNVDPYDKDYNKGFLMNLSEQEKYDDMFPEHPLTMARKFINFISENN